MKNVVLHVKYYVAFVNVILRCSVWQRLPTVIPWLCGYMSDWWMSVLCDDVSVVFCGYCFSINSFLQLTIDIIYFKYNMFFLLILFRAPKLFLSHFIFLLEMCCMPEMHGWIYFSKLKIGRKSWQDKTWNILGSYRLQMKYKSNVRATNYYYYYFFIFNHILPTCSLML